MSCPQSTRELSRLYFVKGLRDEVTFVLYIGFCLLNIAGNDKADEVLRILLGNPNMFGGVLACILDNTVPGKVQVNT